MSLAFARIPPGMGYEGIIIIVAEAVAAITAAIAIWLMSRARFGHPMAGTVVNVTFGRGRSSCVIRGDRRGFVGSTTSAGMWSGRLWMAGTSPGVLFRVWRQCVHTVFTRFLLAVGSRACIMAGLLVTL